MGKHRKTLRQKQLAELRRKENPHKEITSGYTEPEVRQPITHSLPYTFQQKKELQTKQTFTLAQDLTKTIYVSLGIVLSQFILFFLLHNHALVLPLVSLRY